MLIDIVIGVAALAWLVSRQLRSRRVSSSGWRVVLVLAVIGIFDASQFLRGAHTDAVTYAALGGSLVLAAGFGAIRASTVRLWTEAGQVWQKGSWITAALWVLAFAAHLGYDFLLAPGHGGKDVGTATVVLYLAVSLGIQRLVVQQRARRLEPAGPAPFGQTA